VDEAAVVRPAAVLRDRLRLDGGFGLGRVMIHLRAGVDVLALASHGDSDVVVGGAAALQDRRRVQHRRLRAHRARNPLHAPALLGDGALRVEVVRVFRPVLDGRVLDVGVLVDEDFNTATVKIEFRVLRGGTALDVVDLRSFLSDDERMLELAHPLGVHPEVRLNRHVDSGVFGDVDERAAGPDGTVERGELVVARGDALRHEVLADEFFVLLDRLIHVTEDDALLLPALLHVLVDNLRFVLRADAGEGVFLGFGDAQLVEGVFDVVWKFGPVVHAGADVDVRPNVGDDLVDVNFAQVRLTGPVGRHRHLLELFERSQAALQHPLRLVFVLRDDADRLLGEALLGLEGRLLLLFELETGLGVRLFEIVLF